MKVHELDTTNIVGTVSVIDGLKVAPRTVKVPLDEINKITKRSITTRKQNKSDAVKIIEGSFTFLMYSTAVVILVAVAICYPPVVLEMIEPSVREWKSKKEREPLNLPASEVL